SVFPEVAMTGQSAAAGMTPVPMAGDVQVNTFTSDAQRYPAVTSLVNGGFVVTWTSDKQDGSFYGIYGQRYAPDGTAVGGEFQVNTYATDEQLFSSMTSLPDGGFVITWTSAYQDDSGPGIYGQRYSENGSPVGVEFRVNTVTA